MQRKISVLVEVDLDGRYVRVDVAGALTEVNQQALHPVRQLGAQSQCGAGGAAHARAGALGGPDADAARRGPSDRAVAPTAARDVTVAEAWSRGTAANSKLPSLSEVALPELKARRARAVLARTSAIPRPSTPPSGG